MICLCTHKSPIPFERNTGKQLNILPIHLMILSWIIPSYVEGLQNRKIREVSKRGQIAYVCMTCLKKIEVRYGSSL